MSDGDYLVISLPQRSELVKEILEVSRKHGINDDFCWNFYKYAEAVMPIHSFKIALQLALNHMPESGKKIPAENENFIADLIDALLDDKTDAQIVKKYCQSL